MSKEFLNNLRLPVGIKLLSGFTDGATYHKGVFPHRLPEHCQKTGQLLWGFHPLGSAELAWSQEGFSVQLKDNIPDLESFYYEISARLGKARLSEPAGKQWNIGSLIVLDKSVGEGIDLLVEGVLFAKGEALAIEDHFGLGLLELFPENTTPYDDSMNRLSAEMGKCRMTGAEIHALEEGSRVELDQETTEPITILLDGVPFAKGYIEVFEENFAVRVSKLYGEIHQPPQPENEPAMEPEVANAGEPNGGPSSDVSQRLKERLALLDGKVIARIIKNENAWTAALVLSLLEATKAATVYNSFEPAHQATISRFLEDRGPVPLSTLDLVDKHFQEIVDNLAFTQESGTADQHLKKILDMKKE